MAIYGKSEGSFEKAAAAAAPGPVQPLRVCPTVVKPQTPDGRPLPSDGLNVLRELTATRGAEKAF